MGRAIADIQYRDPATGQCQSFGNPYPCDNQCGPCPGYADVLPDWGMCGGACDGLSETQCLATADCHATYQDDSAAKPVFWGCWNMPQSSTIHGACTGLDAQTCSGTMTAPRCTPARSTSRRTSSRRSRLPARVMAAACATLTTESACLARTDCDPIYIGMNCTCDPHGCTCQTETFDHCK
jgi:hypothetical protein